MRIRGLLCGGVATLLVQEPPPTAQELLEQLIRQESPPAQEEPGGLPEIPVDPDQLTPTFPFPVEIEEEPPAIHLYRTSDIVEVLRADGTLRRLQFWDASLTLDRGDQVHQSSNSHSLIDYPDGFEISIDGKAIVQPLSGPEEEPRRLTLPLLDKVAVFKFFETQTLVDLPGGNALIASNTRVTVRDFDRRALEFRNTGPSAVYLRGPYLGDDLLELAAGKLVILPLFPITGQGPRPPLRSPLATPSSPQGASLRVLAPSTVDVTVGEQSVALAGEGPTPSIVNLSGARVLVRPGERLTFERAPLGDSRGKER